MKKKIIFIVILTLFFFPSHSINAEENGWIKTNNSTYYYENGEKVTGFKNIDGKTYFFSYINSALKKGWQNLSGNIFYLYEDGTVADGFQEIEGKKYFFENNYAISGFKDIGGKTYFFSYVDNVLKTGWQNLSGNIFYLYKDGTVKQEWQKIEGKTYYVKDNYMLKGFQEIDGKTYFFSNVNYALKEGIQYIDNKPFYLNKDGTVYKGFKTIDGNTYYFGDKYFAVQGFQEIDGKTYFFSYINGTLKTGWQNLSGNVFYLYEDGTVKQGWQKIEGKTYYVKDNYILKGFQEIDGKTYFFSNVNYALKEGIQYIDNKLFYLNDDGTVYKGWKEINNNTYYFGDEYFAVQGFQKIDDKTYFFSYINSALKKGWQELSNKIFYLTIDGEIVTGNQSIEGRDYYFDTAGYLQGFKNENENLYYYNPDGTKAVGIQRIAGKYYMFNSITGVFEKFVNKKVVIDVSSHNGVIDWEKVKNYGQVDGVILRLGYGNRFLDTQFLNNVRELNRLGIPYSVYLFSYAENSYEAGLEADFVINTVKNNPVSIATQFLSIFYDLEDWLIESTGENSYEISKDSYGQIITAFVNKVESNLGIKTRIYASKNYVYSRFPSYAWPYATWIAQWSPEITYKEAYEGWQYTNDGIIPGINGRVDMSIFYY